VDKVKIIMSILALSILQACSSTDPQVKAPDDIKPRAHGVINHFESALGLEHRADIRIVGRIAERVVNGRPAFMINGVWVHGYAYGGRGGATATVGRYTDGRWDDLNLQHEAGCHGLQLINGVTDGHPDVAMHKGKVIRFKAHCPNWRGGAQNELLIKASGENYLIIDLVMEDRALILSHNKIKTIINEIERELGYE
jgi:hypothetical protein